MIQAEKSCVNGGLCAAFYTLGCRVNQYETQAIEETFETNGFDIKSFSEVCDVYVINTCTVTSESDRKSRQIIRRAAQIKKPSSVIIVCGCYSQGNPKDVLQIPGVDAVLGNAHKSEIYDLAIKLLSEKEEKTINLVDDISKYDEYENMSISSSDRTRAFVKIVDGCENKCTYCIIPSVRGKVRSRKSEEILDEVEKLSKNGYKEVVLTGIETAAYGRDINKSNQPLAKLISDVSNISGIERIRLGSMEPTVFTEEFVSAISKLKKLMPHFHLSLQSGSDSVLKLMKRKYNSKQFKNVCNTLRKYIPNVKITTDIIVGFPGETDEMFSETENLLRSCRFSYAHIFPYSKREGTPAAKMPCQLANSVKKDRAARLEKAMKEVRHNILKEQIGKRKTVLFETSNDKVLIGHSEDYIKVIAENNSNDQQLVGNVRNVLITGITDDTDGISCLCGKLIY